ncbi:sensor domain-containing diguanylate cyclase [Leptospira kirschneri]|uniref:diguanylate cyclase n=1 Tax=Leptospira kirschneri str. 200802841 TaxID=1193047 RepID=A0A828Y7E8_9LEPT|nr:sensor domain-containing diguanylate cyclase [Leptospira kirschneri]EMO73897.1 diguanylate cyclase (GGDEF) domain protein [Leptospira kirschneri str. 200801925]EJO68788.1 diguanylate cyclase (GGDEF) domain protein [Leptospira kirschneri serovar Grippotyphosa str. RM52]EKO51298.1 diguanylate cyclase (GGDEF) domain protein [Leptospira kirschneri str. 200802841]EKP06573.1 diguanylate cyclase (GGDEF) domain protein [Leptospira kirschneri str. 2008720114]EKQ82407.1 diguanylate cyclase (GGDEF) do
MDHENEYNHEKFFNYSLDLHAIQRMDGVVLQINQSFQRIMGWTNEDLKGRTHFHLLHPEDVESSLKEFEQLNEGVSHLSIQNRCRCADGTYKYFSWTAFPDLESGRIYVTGRDITDIIESNQKINKLASDLEEANNKLLEQASTDPLTKLKNRRAFNEEINHLIRLGQRQEKSISLMMIDVDHFKDYNDKFGHPAGDRVLIRLSEVFMETLRTCDLIARFGGEEFVVALSDTNEEKAVEVAERLMTNVKKQSWENSPITISVGITTLNFNDSAPIYHTDLSTGIIEEADRALYRSKANGRNQTTHSSQLKT